MDPIADPGLYGEEKNILPLPGSSPEVLAHPACSLVAMPTKLSQLMYRLG
jgi:hypothetical protein